MLFFKWEGSLLKASGLTLLQDAKQEITDTTQQMGKTGM